MRLTLIGSFFALIALALALPAVTGSVGVVHAAQIVMQGEATPAQEVPTNNSFGKATVRFVFDDAAKTLTYVVDVHGLSSDLITAAHIHRAAAGVNGPVVYPIGSAGFTHASGSINLTDGDISDLQAGRFYFNVHSKDHPGGFARFQLVMPAAPTPSVTPPRTGDAGLQAAATGAATGSVALIAVMALSGAGVLSVVRRRS